MVYVAKTVKELRTQAGTLLQKVASELALIDAAIDAAAGGAWSALASARIIVGNGSGVATSVAMSGDIAIDNAGATAIQAGKVTQAMHAAASEDGTVAKVVAEDNVIGGLPVVFMINIDAGDVGAKNITMTHKVRVLDAYVILRGAGVGSCTLTVGNGANAITNAMAVSGSDQAVVRAASIDDAYYEIAATTGTLRVTTAAGATQPECLVVVTAVRIT